MSLTLTSPITGGAQTGFTTPSYTIVADTAPTTSGKQYAISAMSGAGVPVDPSTTSRPYTVTLSRPAILKSLSVVDPITGVLRSVPRNSFTCIVRKGVTPLAGQAPAVLVAKLTVDVPAGADLADAANLRSAMSVLVGALNQVSAGFGDTLIAGTI